MKWRVIELRGRKGEGVLGGRSDEDRFLEEALEGGVPDREGSPGSRNSQCEDYRLLYSQLSLGSCTARPCLKWPKQALD